MEALAPSRNSYLFLLVAVLGWGLSSSFIEFGLEFLNPIPFLFYRFFVVVIVLTPYTLLSKRKEMLQIISNKWTWLVGLSESLGLILQYLGQERSVPAGLASLLSLLFLLIVPFLSPFVLNEKLRLYHIVAMLIGFFGVILISGVGRDNDFTTGSNIGIGLLIGAAFGYAIYIISTSRLTTKELPDLDTFTLFYIILVFITLSSFISTLIFSEFQPIPISAIKYILLLSLFSTLIAFFAYFKALKEISANAASVMLPMQSLVPFAIDYIFIGRRYGSSILLGSLSIIIAMIIVVSYPYYITSRRNGIEPINQVMQ